MGECEQAKGSKQGTVTHNQSLPTETCPAFSPLEQCPLAVVAGLVALVVVVVSLLGSEDGEGDVGEEEIERRNRVLSFFDSVHSLTHSLALPDLCRPCVDVPNCGCAQITPSFRHPVNQQTPLAPSLPLSLKQQTMSTAHIHPGWTGHTT